MDQISPPMRIVLAVAVVFLAAWMLVLRPKGDDTSQPAATPATPPASASAQDDNKAKTALGKAVESARGAKDATEDEQNRQEAAGNGTKAANPPSTSSPTPTKPATPPSAASKPAKPRIDPDLAKLPDWLQHAMDKKVVAILFTNGRSADDRRTRRALEHAFTAHGRVVKRAVPVSRIARYRPVTEGVDVQQSPTLMVIDRHRSAQALVGYSSLHTVNQAIIDGLLATHDPVEHVRFLQDLQRECRQIHDAAVVGPGSHTVATMSSSLGTVRNAPAPHRYQRVKHVATRYLAAELSITRQLNGTDDRVRERQIRAGDDRLRHRALLELNAVGVSACN